VAVPGDPTIPDAPAFDAATSLVTPQQAMRLLEARRARTFSIGLAILAAFTALVVWQLGGDPLAQRIHIAGLLATSLVMTAYAVWRRDLSRYRPIEVVVLAAVAMLANGTGFYYWGVYSAYLAAVTVAGYAFASSVSHRRGVLVLTVVCIVLHTGLGVAQLAGWIESRGMAEPTALASQGVKIVVLGMLQLMTLTAILGGLDTRSQMQRILDEHHTALVELSRRDAQLAEAHEDAREARQPGEGRFTGQQLGRFRLRGLLGRGAMGDVYDAIDDQDAPCAVKVLAANLLDNEDALRRFQREARAIQAIEAPNIVKMLEVSPPSAAQPFLAMERLHGRDLAEILKERSLREAGEVVEIVRSIAAGLEAAHAAGVVHRDLKPANVFAAETPGGLTWKVLDFGVAKVAGDATLTAGQLVGTPGYMAPEQARGEAVTAASDVYALGIIAYRLLTGRPAVMPAEPHAMVHEVVYRMPARPSDLAPMSSAVEDVLAVALAKRPTERFVSAGAFASSLADAATGRRSVALAARAAAILDKLPWGAWSDRPDRKKTARPGTARG
jgi:hypothetical protein